MPVGWFSGTGRLGRYQAKPDGNDDLRDILKALAAARPRWGQERLHVLVGRQGYLVNHKRTERLDPEWDSL